MLLLGICNVKHDEFKKIAESSFENMKNNYDNASNKKHDNNLIKWKASGASVSGRHMDPQPEILQF